MFLRPYSLEYNNHSIYPDWYLTSDYAPLTVNISIFEENIQTKKCTLIKNSEEEDNFIVELIEAVKGLNTSNIQNKEELEDIVQSFVSCMEKNWYKHSKIVNITKHSKAWWDKKCHRDLESFRQTKRIENWKCFKCIVKRMKHNFFDSRIQEIANKNCGP